MIKYLILILLITITTLPYAQSISGFHKKLPEKTISSAVIDIGSIDTAWKDLTQKHFIPAILVRANSSMGPKHEAELVRLEHIKLSDLLDRITKPLGYNWNQDDQTGLIWITPNGFDLSILNRIQFNSGLRGESLRLMDDVLLPEFQAGNITMPSFVRNSTWHNTFNASVNITGKDLTLPATLSDVCLSYLPITFLIDVSNTYCMITPFNLSAEYGAGIREGDRIFAQNSFGKPKLETVEIARLLADKDAAVSEMAFQYYSLRNSEIIFDQLPMTTAIEDKTYAAIAESRLRVRSESAGMPTFVTNQLYSVVADSSFRNENPVVYLEAALELSRLNRREGINALQEYKADNINMTQLRPEVIRALRGVGKRQTVGSGLTGLNSMLVMESKKTSHSQLIQYMLEQSEILTEDNTTNN